MATCPHCNGSGISYVINPSQNPPVLTALPCPVCKGTGKIPDPVKPPPPEPYQPWLLLIPVAIFFLFFLFLTFGHY